MSVERVRVRRRSRRGRGAFGCIFLLLMVMLLCVGAVLIILPAAPQIALQIAGFQPAGQTDDLFTGNTLEEAVGPPVVDTSNFTSPPRSVNASIVTVSSPDVGTTSVDMSPYSVQQFRDAQERETIAVRLTESDLLNICQSYTTACSGQSDLPVRNVRVDMRSGGAIIYADVNLPELGITQNAGFVVQFVPESARFTIAGVDLGGTLYKSPPETFGISLRELEIRGNNALQQAQIQMGGMSYGIAAIYADDASINIILR